MNSRFATAVMVTAALAGTTLAAQKMQINGAGATFPNPIYSKWFTEYNRIHPDIAINYQPQGSGAGIRLLTQRTVFFGASDQPMTPDQMLAAPGKVLHFPTVLGSVVPICNLPGVTQELKFTGAVLADIVLGKITKWNDPALAKLNPGVFRVSITNPPGDNAYPIASFTWLLLYENAQDKAQSKVMVDFLKWALTDGQKFAAELGYAPVPKNVVELELNALEKVKVQ